MIFNDNESLSNLYEAMRAGHARKVHAREHQGFWTKAKEESDKVPCPCTQGKECTKKGCVCKACAKGLKESKKEDKPDYMDADEDGDKKESMKKALKDKAMKESSNFKKLFSSVMTESAYSGPFEIAKKVWKLGRIVTDQRAPYVVTMKDGKESPLKGESILNLLKNEKSDWVHNVKSIRPAYPEGSNKESAYDTVDDI